MLERIVRLELEWAERGGLPGEKTSECCHVSLLVAGRPAGRAFRLGTPTCRSKHSPNSIRGNAATAVGRWMK